MADTRGSTRPVAHDVAVRAIILANVVRYASAADKFPWPRDESRRMLPDEAPDAYRRTAMRLWEDIWTKLERYRSELTLTEGVFFNATVLTLTERQRIDAAWRVESLQVLLWAMGFCERLPAYDVAASAELTDLAAVADAPSFLPSVRLRPFPEISRARDIAELWHWRSRTRQLIEEKRPFPQTAELQAIGLRTSDDVVRRTALQCAADGTLSAIADEDFIAFGKPYRDLTEDEWSTARSITVERHYALNWLCGYAPENDWERTPTET